MLKEITRAEDSLIRSIVLKDVTERDENELFVLLAELDGSTNHNIVTLIDEARAAFVARTITLPLVMRIGRWCHTSSSMTSAVDPARRLAIFLLGFVPTVDGRE